jgi:nitrite reductase/ring-hydroxylating ferredoxin subunit
MKTRTPEVEPIGPDGKPLSEQPRWRQDFPIDTAQDNYVARRDFTKFLVLTSAAFTTGQFVIAARGLAGGSAVAPAPFAIIAADRLPVGGAKAFVFPSEHDACLLVRVDEDTYVAYGQECTHLSCAVVPEPDKNRFFCPCHEGAFDLRSGRPIAGPPKRPLPRVTLEIRDGVVYATGVELRSL